MSCEWGPCPAPQTAAPAKPAPASIKSSKDALGTIFTLAVPCTSTNWASRNSISRSSNCFLTLSRSIILGLPVFSIQRMSSRMKPLCNTCFYDLLPDTVAGDVCLLYVFHVEFPDHDIRPAAPKLPCHELLIPFLYTDGYIPTVSPITVCPSIPFFGYSLHGLT